MDTGTLVLVQMGRLGRDLEFRPVSRGGDHLIFTDVPEDTVGAMLHLGG